jgi:hypothetical protein
MDEERRKLERFQLHAPARILLESEDRKGEYNLMTRDVSSGGAFLYSSHAFPKGASVKMEFLILQHTLGKASGDKGRAKVRVKGKVVRADSDGIAISFESGYKITALESN